MGMARSLYRVEDSLSYRVSLSRISVSKGTSACRVMRRYSVLGL